MKKILLLCMMCVFASMSVSCSESTSSETESSALVTEQEEVAESEENVDFQGGTVAPVEVVEEGMTPVYADEIKDGIYSIEVNSSSSMFKITACELTVKEGKMSAVMTMSGTGYRYLFMGTGAEAETADESEYIDFVEDNGVHKFTVPVEALDMGIDCTAFSDKKEKWYDRTILFCADSLPSDAFADGTVNTVESLGLTDGDYTIEVSLEGGSGKASILPHTQLTIADGVATAKIIWNSSNYDYMIVDSEKYLPISEVENSTFEIPVSSFDFKMPVSADTTAMSTPHEIEYTLYFDSSTIVKL